MQLGYTKVKVPMPYFAEGKPVDNRLSKGFEPVHGYVTESMMHGKCEAIQIQLSSKQQNMANVKLYSMLTKARV